MTIAARGVYEYASSCRIAQHQPYSRTKEGTTNGRSLRQGNHLGSNGRSRSNDLRRRRNSRDDGRSANSEDDRSRRDRITSTSMIRRSPRWSLLNVDGSRSGGGSFGERDRSGLIK